jgi:hypothetical protein
MPNWAEASTQRGEITSFLFPSFEMRRQNIESVISDSVLGFDFAGAARSEASRNSTTARKDSLCGISTVLGAPAASLPESQKN